MSSGGRTASVKRGLLAGVALVVLSWAGLVHAADAPAPAAPARTTPPADGLKVGEMYMEADLVIRDDKAKTITARGGVEVRYEGRTLRTQELVYDQARGVITATGDVQIINDDGSVEYGDHIVLDDKMQAGVIQGFSTRMPATADMPPVKLAAASAVRRNENVNELNRAIYTPCDICAADGTPKHPSWSIKAEKVVQDHVHQLVYYRNATIQILGVPVLYLPVFWHPDPQAVRKSGFLPPNFGASNRRGVSYEQPYVQVLSKSSDITLSPQINTRVNPFLNGRYRQRFHSGALEARFGYTHDQDFDGKGNAFGDDTSRSYLLATGAFAINEKWRWGFTAERTSDKLLFDKYDVGDVYVARGPYVADDRRLISQIYATRQDQRSWFSVAAFSIQGLRPGDNDRTFPVVGPLVEARWEPDGNVMNGRLRLLGSAVALTRDQSPLTPALNLPGIDSRRVTGEADWRATFTSTAGVRLSPFLNARLDGYSLADLNGVSGSSKSVSRGMAAAGADISWPFVRKFKDSIVVLEPVAQLVLSPKVRQVRVGVSAAGAPIYLNEDSVAFEFDETNLFRPNKFPGYDLYEDGVRANVGGRASVLWDDGRRASLLIGRSFRDTDNGVFSTTSGLAQKSSDWIVAGDAQPMPGLSLFTRARLDAEDLTVERAEAGANISVKRGSGYFRYLRDSANPAGAKVENVDLGGEVFLSQHWGVTAYGNRDLAQNAWVIRDLGVVYRDECTRVDVIYRREDVVIGRLGKSESLTIRLTLATLGGPMYAH
ncbi:MAG TPA: LPS-assembly protein LptD [Phenylobacterium sp.]|nr:LPS-assembly protein LptD [Phenylobacterium sp.]